MSDPNFVESMGCFGLRAWILHGATSPLDVVKKTMQASSHPLGALSATRMIWQERGLRGFWGGFFSKGGKIALNQTFRGPLLTHVPYYLGPYKFGDLTEQALTGLVVAKVDALTSKHLDRSQILAAVNGHSVSLRQFFAEGARGYSTYWSYLSVSWVSSLVSLKLFKEENATLLGDVKRGVKAGFVVSIANIAFDNLNTARQVNGVDWKIWFKQVGFRGLARGWPIQVALLVIHNVGTSLTFRALEK